MKTAARTQQCESDVENDALKETSLVVLLVHRPSGSGQRYLETTPGEEELSNTMLSCRRLEVDCRHGQGPWLAVPYREPRAGSRVLSLTMPVTEREIGPPAYWSACWAGSTTRVMTR